MKNKFNFLIVIAIMVFVIGCSCGKFVDFGSKDNSTEKKTSDSGDNKTITDKVTEEIADGETSGVPECDDLMKFMREQSQSPDDNWVTKAAKDYVIGLFKKSLRESLEQNKNDKPKMAEQCKDLRTKLENRLNEEKQKKGEK